jgi:Divergent InlB B-repeat domain
MRRSGALVVLVLLALVASGPASTRPGAGRVTADQPDELAGAQVHVVYALPTDGTDRALDTNGTLAASVSNWEAWLRGQTGGHGLRLDTYLGAPDITFFRVNQTEADMKARGAFARDEIERELIASGLTKPDKIYAVYYDGQSTNACGGGAWPPTLKGIVGAIYLPSTFWNTSGAPCYVPEQSLARMSLMDYAILHELLHTIGIVPTCAPHHTLSGHVSDSPTDLMYAGGQPWQPSVLDVGRDDYFNAHIAGCQDLADSAYLEGNDPLPLTVAVTGNGKVTSTPAGIDCGATCTASFARGTTVTLEALPADGSQFAGWSGACAGTAECTVTLTVAASVNAAFEAMPKVLPKVIPKPKPKPKCKKGQRSTKKHPCRR